jgi:hypothetical protein
MTERLEERRHPTPILQHLARCFAEVVNGGGAVEERVFRLGHEVMDSVAKFMEEELDLVVGK